ncbi:hypothetical protein K501DRAFT_176861 [Backusella circina FSU 941]|nr:hypothetical protein K501DRAFT_176861 [Backusella circina FSU 941]
MTSYGTQVKQSNVKEVVEATGQKEYLVFFFDRQYLDALPEDTVALLDAETPTLEPKIALFDKNAQLKTLQNISSRQSLGQNCEQFLSLFAYFDSYSQALIRAASSHTELAKTIVEGQKLQSMALNVALTNLETHNINTTKSVEQFITLAEKELVRQSDLINSIHNDIGILRNIKIHPSILPLMDQAQTTFQEQGKEENITRSGEGERLVDFIDESAVDMLKSETVTFCTHSTQNIRELQNMVKHLQVCEKELQQYVASSTNLQALDASLADIQELFKKAQYLRDRIKRDLTRVYNKIADLLHVPVSSLFSSGLAQQQVNTGDAKRGLEAVAHLANIHITDYLPKLSDYENQIRQRITELTIQKRRSIQHFIENMHTISFLQNDIAEVMPTLGAAESYMQQFKDMNGENGLENARKILFAYGALMIEIVRRNEYIALLIENANLFADIFARYRDQEEERRGYFRHEVYQLLPFKLAVLDKVSPQCDITTTARDDDESFKLRKKDIIDFISLLTQAYAQSPQSTPSSPKRFINKRISSPTSITSSRRVTEHPDNKLLGLLNNMNHQLNGLRDEFLKALESSCNVLKMITIVKKVLI